MIASGNDRFDVRQWRALTRAYLVTDHAALLGGHGRREQRGALVNLLTLGVVGLTASIGPALLVLLTRDRFAAAVLMCTSIGMTTAVAVLGQASSLASPEDLEVVGCRPVGSRTYFAVRATSLVLNTAFTVLLTGACRCWPL
jgi:hypothetical protein